MDHAFWPYWKRWDLYYTFPAAFQGSYRASHTHQPAPSVYEEEDVEPVALVPTGATSSLAEAVIHLLLSPPDDQQYHEHLQRVATNLHILLEEVQDPQHLLEVLQALELSRVALPINKAILELDSVTHSSITCLHPRKEPRDATLGRLKGLTSSSQTQPLIHRLQNELVSTLHWAEGQKDYSLLGRKALSLVGLQFCIVNYQSVLAKYNFNTYGRLAEFRDELPV